MILYFTIPVVFRKGELSNQMHVRNYAEKVFEIRNASHVHVYIPQLNKLANR